MGQTALKMIESYYTMGASDAVNKKKDQQGQGSQGAEPGTAPLSPSSNAESNPMQRRMDQGTMVSQNDPMHPQHEQDVNAGLDALPSSGLPKQQQDYLASLMVAGLTHGRYGLPADHLISDYQPNNDETYGA